MTISKNMRLGACVICEDKAAKYKCPKCQFSTCSLKCVQLHKVENNCDGIRDKSRYIPKDKIADIDIMSDYRLLESTTRCIDSYNRDVIKRSTRRFRDPHNIPLPPHLMKFRNACYRRGKCRLHFLPQKFERHEQNTSRFNWKKNEIFWRIQIKFPHTMPIAQTYTFNYVSEKTLIYDLLRPFIEGNTHVTAINEDTAGDTLVIDKKCLEKYDVYKAAGFNGLKILLKSEGDMAGSKRYRELDLSQSLSHNLSEKNIVEHPVLLVILKHHSDSFDIDDDPDDERDDQEKTTQKIERNTNALTGNCSASEEIVPKTNEGLMPLNENFQLSPARSSTMQSTIYTSMGTTTENPIHSNPQQSSPAVATGPITRKEAEFKQSCYDFYLKYYSEKYGNTSCDTRSGNMSKNFVPAVKSNDAPVVTFNNVQNSISSSPSTPRMIRNPIETNSVNPIPGSIASTTVDVVKESTYAMQQNKAQNNSLQLLTIYSDSEEEMET